MASAQRVQDSFDAAVAQRRRTAIINGAGRTFFRPLSVHVTSRFGVILGFHEDQSDHSLMLKVGSFVLTRREKGILWWRKATIEWKQETEHILFEDFEEKFGNPELVDIKDDPSRFFCALAESISREPFP